MEFNRRGAVGTRPCCRSRCDRADSSGLIRLRPQPTELAAHPGTAPTQVIRPIDWDVRSACTSSFRCVMIGLPRRVDLGMGDRRHKTIRAGVLFIRHQEPRTVSNRRMVGQSLEELSATRRASVAFDGRAVRR